jgi:predicted Zn finger-like uncharacterized protein
MILNCNSCKKKFVVPDQAITAKGRMVQCSSCGNKWKQFPVEVKPNVTQQNLKTNNIKTPKPAKKKNIKQKKNRETSLYSPEYLAKKHGIVLNNVKTNNLPIENKKVSFGFYNSLILFIVTVIALSKGLHFFQEFIVKKFPFTKFYLDYFFESIRNIFEIWKNLIISY